VVKKIAAALIWAVIALEAVVFFLPKKEIYYLGERYLDALGVAISSEEASDYGWLFSLKGGAIYYDRMQTAENNRLSLFASIFYNELSLEPFSFASELNSIFPTRVDFLKARHTIFLPHKIFLSGEGEIGAISGWIDLFARKIYIVINAPSEIQQKYGQIFAVLEKKSEGFVYERDF
jgi:hypothetical protein